jgi:hypothetical protein
MSITLDTIDQIFLIRNKVKNKKIISIGNHVCGFKKIPKSLLKKWNLKTEINTELLNSDQNNKSILNKIFMSFGFV